MDKRARDVSPSTDNPVLTGSLAELLAYLAVSDRPSPADLIVGLGSDSAEVGEQAAELYAQGLAPRVLFSGGRGRLTGAIPGTEAEFLRGVAVERGTPPEAILMEEASTNMLENIEFSAVLLNRENLAPERVLLVTQPVLQRRAWATTQMQWKDVHVLNCPPDRHAPLDWGDAHGVARLRSLAVGEMERLRRYAAKGDIQPQRIPESVQRAYETLAAHESQPEG